MRNTLAILVRELRSAFGGPVAYVAAGMFLLINGFIFSISVTAYHAESQNAQRMGAFMQQPVSLNVTEYIVEPMFGTMAFIALFIVPLVTMRVFAEENRQGTMELLRSYPLRDWELLLGKYLAALCVFGFMVAPTVVYMVIANSLAPAELPVIATGYLGLLLTGAAFLATGVFVSTLTANQIIAAVVSYAVLLVVWVSGVVEPYVPGALGTILNQLSLFAHIMGFGRGVINSHDVVYFALWIGVFLFLTALSLETRRWAGKAA